MERPVTEELKRNDRLSLKPLISTENLFINEESDWCLMTGPTWRISVLVK